MWTSLVIMIVALAAPDPAVPLSPGHLYNGIDRSIPIEVTPPPGVDASELELIIMAHDGAVLGGPVQVESGLVDLAELFPTIWDLRRAAFLQLRAVDRSVGAPVVLQPMLSRMVPITREARNPAGITYTEITGWYDERNPPAPPEPPPAPPQREEVSDGPITRPPVGYSPESSRRKKKDDDETGTEAEAETDEPPADEPVFAESELAPPPEPKPRLITGLRVYPEHDVLLETTRGTIRLAMRPDEAPNTAFNFLQLCEGGFYRDVIFHRVVPFTRIGDPFVIQAGDPGGSGDGGPGYWLPVEPSGLAHDFGVISMARDVNPDSAGSQFFICLSRRGTARLDGHYCAFGYAVDGAETIRSIAAVELADVERGRPRDPTVITSATLVPAPPREPGRGRPDQRVRPEAPVDNEPRRVPR